MATHDFTGFALGIPAGYNGDGLGTDWEIVDVPTIGRRLYVPAYPSFTWLQTGSSAVITSAALEFEAPDNNAFNNIIVGIRANGVEFASFNHSTGTLGCATYGSFEVIDPIPARLRLEVELDSLTVTATLKNADTNAVLGACSDSIFSAPAGVFGMFVGGYPAAIEATISRFEWSEETNISPEPATIGQFEIYQPARAPAFLQNQTARAWNAELGRAKDVLLDRAAESVRARSLALNTDDAALQIGLERSMPRYPAETMQQYRARLLAVWESKQFAGTVKGIRDELLAMGYETSIVFERTDVGNWSELTVRINSASVANWAAHLTLEVKTRVVLAVLRLKPAHTKLRAITAGSSDILFYKQLRWGERPVGQKWKFVSRKWRQGVIL